MLTFSKLGEKGNLGNQLFQIASVIGIALRNNQQYSFPRWSYSQYFEKPLPVNPGIDTFVKIDEKTFHHYEWNLDDGNYDLNGWLQSEKYFETADIKEILAFNNVFKQDLLNRYSFLFQKKSILISVRRGDFVNHPYYFQLSYKYYFLALIENFPDWEQRTILFTSDDIAYCKYHFSFIDTAFFLEGLSPVEQLVLGSQCDDFIISNSTFSWWIAWIGEKTNTKVIRPISNFRGSFAKMNNDSDYFPERWICFSDTLYRIPAKYFSLKMKGYSYKVMADIKFKSRQLLNSIKKTIKKYAYVVIDKLPKSN